MGRQMNHHVAVKKKIERCRMGSSLFLARGAYRTILYAQSCDFSNYGALVLGSRITTSSLLKVFPNHMAQTVKAKMLSIDIDLLFVC